MLWPIITSATLMLMGINVDEHIKDEYEEYRFPRQLIIGGGILAGCALFFEQALLAKVWLIGILAFMIILVYWDYTYAKTTYENVMIAVMLFIVSLVLGGVANRIEVVSPFWQTIIRIIPISTLIIAETIVWAQYCFYQAIVYGDDAESKNKSTAFKVLGAVVLFIGLVLLFNIGSSVFNNNGDPAPSQATPASDPYPEFFHWIVVSDDIQDNDLDFGPPPEELSVEFCLRDFEDRMSRSPAFGASVLGHIDMRTGTNYIGGNVPIHNLEGVINSKISLFVQDKETYLKKAQDGLSFLKENSSNITVEKRHEYLDYQMFMQGQAGIIPTVIVDIRERMITSDFLVFHLNLKGEIVEVAFRLPCGYQPTSFKVVPRTPRRGGPKIIEVPREVPKIIEVPRIIEIPVPKEIPPPIIPKQPDPLPPPKDKTKGLQGDLVAPNDDAGPGRETFKKGSNLSTEDQPTNSNHYTELPPLLENTNTTVEEVTGSEAVFDNGSSDTGYTPEAPVAETVDNTQITSTSGDGLWEGPPN